ncbi:hypothetical protein OG604_48820 [Streptomyces sp. NBC_01231]|nr:hypothetical protein OG604_48820 [Streptomyces sp. NBC_01231]
MAKRTSALRLAMQSRAWQRVEALQAELREAEAVRERFVIARETVGEVLAEPRGGEEWRRSWWPANGRCRSGSRCPAQ